MRSQHLEDNDGHCVGMYELLEAVEAVIKAADPEKREALAETIDAYAENFMGEEFFWAMGPQSPVRKPEGNA